MSVPTDLTVLIPAYNEAENLKILLPKWIDYCASQNWNIILINDGSTDATKEILKSISTHSAFQVVHHKLNKGYGAAIKSGIQQCLTEYCITIDADGQHHTEDIRRIYERMVQEDADLIVGSRLGTKSASAARGIGKSVIRMIAKIMMKVPIHDLNSGMKMYRTDLAQKYLQLTPDTMAFSDIITLVFINNKHLVIEEPIAVANRMNGKSTIGMQTAFQTLMEILNIVVLFNPMKVFLPISLLALLLSLIWGVPLILKGHGLSTGTLLGLFSAVIFFVLGLIAEQLTLIRKNQK